MTYARSSKNATCVAPNASNLGGVGTETVRVGGSRAARTPRGRWLPTLSARLPSRKGKGAAARKATGFREGGRGDRGGEAERLKHPLDLRLAFAVAVHNDPRVFGSGYMRIRRMGNTATSNAVHFTTISIYHDVCRIYIHHMRIVCTILSVLCVHVLQWPARLVLSHHTYHDMDSDSTAQNDTSYDRNQGARESLTKNEPLTLCPVSKRVGMTHFVKSPPGYSLFSNKALTGSGRIFSALE